MAGNSVVPAQSSPRDYAAQQLALMLGTRAPAPVELLDQLARALNRDEERGAELDGHGNFPAQASELWPGALLEAPPLDDRIAAFAAGQTGLPPRWPGGHRFALCLTHDVDRIVSLPAREMARQVAAVGGQASFKLRSRWRASSAVGSVLARFGRNDRVPFDAWIAEEARLGFHSTFFVLPERLTAATIHDQFYRYDDVVLHGGRELPLREALRATRAAGWEIGLHGSYASAYDAAMLAAEREQREAALGVAVTSTRQHYLRFGVERTPDVQAAAGLRADSTLGYSSTIGLRAGTSLPFFWASAPGLLEVPLAIQDVGLLRVHGRGVDVGAQIARAQTLIRRIAQTGGVATLSWHTHAESRGALPAYRALLETAAELGAWGCTLGELEHWWRGRSATLGDIPGVRA
jgi:peptidoglycan/xylan/chitin deacetylase (PgdA/CDA1 family)